MFSISIFNKKENKLFLIKDRFGIKPLYYSFLNGQLVFSSELNSLIPILKNKLSIDYQAISNFISLGFFNSPLTVYNEIKKLESASILTFDFKKKKISIKKWWNLKPNKKYKKYSFKKACDKIEKQLIRSVNLWSVSDVPICFMLSGGIDSGLLASMYLDNNILKKKKIKTYSYVFNSSRHFKNWNEIETIKSFTNKFKNQHKNYFFSNKRFKDDLINIQKQLGEPYGGSLPPWYLLREIKKNYKVVISGTGGDELFGNYNRPFNILKNKNTNIYNLRNFKTNYFYKKMYNADRNFKIKYTSLNLKNLEDPAQKYFNLIKSRKKKYSKINNLSLLDIDLGLTDDFLYNSDRFSMQHSVELRTPYLDHNLVEAVYGLQEKVRINKKLYKPILKSLAKKYLPNEYIKQTKKGFTVPFSILMRGNLKKLVNKYLSKKNLNKVGIINEIFLKDFVKPMLDGENKNIQLIWNILMLQVWFLSIKPSKTN